MLLKPYFLSNRVVSSHLNKDVNLYLGSQLTISCELVRLTKAGHSLIYTDQPIPVTNQWVNHKEGLRFRHTVNTYSLFIMRVEDISWRNPFPNQMSAESVTQPTGDSDTRSLL